MEARIKAGPLLVDEPIKKGRLVTAIEAVVTEGSGLLPPVKVMRVSFTTRDEQCNVIVDKNGKPVVTKKEYDHVITTIPLTTLRTLDIDNARLNFKQKTALRILQYGPSIKGGQSYADRCIRAVVYPSYGLPDAVDPTAVLIASYCWTHDAVRMGALINAGPEADMRLKDLVLRDLAVIHNLDYEFLAGLYVEHFAFDWTHNPLTQGAFAFFGPGEFSTVYESLNSFAADGHLHFAGEAISTRHAWVVGALDSAWRAVLEMLQLSYHDKIDEFNRLWGRNLEWVIDQTGTMIPPPDGKGPLGIPGSGLEDDLLLKHMMNQNLEFFRQQVPSS
ncbi:hypothetical protein FRB93_003919 [Tulasnella sp. JGI-2019a]|nr:hypothetical protein FRB93_003919 [Tulasnella sp. JGI-2019a]